jgi:predicted ATPase
MALYTGAAEEQGGDYFGPPLNRVARLLSAAHGGQVLLSLPTQELVRDLLPVDAELRELGEHRLKDLARPERIYQLVATGLPGDFPSLRTLESRPNNLPMQPTLLVGREREVEDVRGRLLAPEVRLLTLTGPGGTGKSRLALQAAADLFEEFEDGVFFVALATLTDPALVASSVAQVLGVRESADQPLLEGIKDYLQDKRLLLVLDNFEQVLEAAPLAGEILSAAPRLKVLATSRIPLGIYGEREYAVPPLAIPDPKRLPTLEILSHYEAVRLFVERAEATKAGFEITSENAPAVAEICARLDGLPLAIELAAARIKLLPPSAILARLSNRLKLLTGGARDLPERQRTLRGTIEWSHTLLEEGEKTLFARMAVFLGGRTLEAVEAVCGAVGDLPMDAFDGVSSLVDKSLLRQEEGPEGEPRFVMLETIHEYAREKLRESGEAEELGRAHARHFLDLAEEAELTGPEQAGWLELLEAEHDNLRAVLSRSLEGEDPELGLRLASALRYFWFLRGHWSEGRGWLEEVLAANAGAEASVRAKALGGLAKRAVEQGDHERAKTLLGEALVLSRKLGSMVNFAEGLETLAEMAAALGDFPRAARLWGAANTLREVTGSPWMPLERRLHEPHLVAAWARLDEADWTRAWEEGRAMPQENVITYALEDAKKLG